jgi:hypothetical protein
MTSRATHYSHVDTCDAGYQVMFDEGRAQFIEGNVSVQGRIVMHGQRDNSTGLWTVPLDAKSTKKMSP